MNLPVPYDPEFAAWQQPLIIFTPSHDGWSFDFTEDLDLARSLYFDKQGEPITMQRWGELRHDGLDADGGFGQGSYVRIGQDVVGEATVSTVWMGLDHGFDFGRTPGYRPVIFETMIFGGEHDDALMRYCTEEEAVKGHAEAVTDLRAGMRPWWAYGGEPGDEWRMKGGP